MSFKKLILCYFGFFEILQPRPYIVGGQGRGIPEIFNVRFLIRTSEVIKNIPKTFYWPLT